MMETVLFVICNKITLSAEGIQIKNKNKKNAMKNLSNQGAKSLPLRFLRPEVETYRKRMKKDSPSTSLRYVIISLKKFWTQSQLMNK